MSGISSCSTPQVKEISQEERIKLDHQLGLSLAPNFEAAHRFFKKDPMILRYLNDLGAELANVSPDLKKSPLRVFVLQENAWKNYSLPGNRVYLSSSLLKTLGFENEIAAAIALELGNLQRRNVASRFESLKDPENPLKNDAIFQFPDSSLVAATGDGVQILYQAGYDPRGMVMLLNRLMEKPERSTYSEETLSKMIENARRIIALQAPLRNPIVRSAKFLTIAKRMQKL